MRKTIFRGQLRPACLYCRFGERMADTGSVICSKKGIVDEGYHCRLYDYDPLRRIPPRRVAPREFTQ